MKFFLKLNWLGLAVGVMSGVFSASSRTAQADLNAGASYLPLAPQEKLITILATNDIHGGLEPTWEPEGQWAGGMAYWAGIVNATRMGLSSRYGWQAGVLVVDAGDQFQGTLISNHNKGQLMFSAMNHIGYDAIVAGNHDYDFGPAGSWLQDEYPDPRTQAQKRAGVPDRRTPEQRRGALMQLLRQARFPMLSANTYIRGSLVEVGTGAPLITSPVGCATLNGVQPDWMLAVHPPFLAPFVIKEVAGVRVALIGLDNPVTPLQTRLANVWDLCFRDEFQSYLEAYHRAAAAGAQVFVLLIHDGNTRTSFGVSNLVKRLTSLNGQRLVDAVIAGHTHEIQDEVINGVPVIQSGVGGDRFGRISLVWDTETKTLVPSKMRHAAGVTMFYGKCADQAREFCSNRPGDFPAYDGVQAGPNLELQQMIQMERQGIQPLALRRMGFAAVPMIRDSRNESLMADFLTSSFLTIANHRIQIEAKKQRKRLPPVAVAFINTGEMRANFRPGLVTYEDLFRVLPANHRALEVGPMSADQLRIVLESSIHTCDQGALMQAGLRVVYEQDCRRAVNGKDPQARLIRVDIVPRPDLGIQEATLFDADAGLDWDRTKTYYAATFDTLLDGESGYVWFTGAPILFDFGNLREMIAQYLQVFPANFMVQPDARWVNALGPRLIY